MTCKKQYVKDRWSIDGSRDEGKDITSGGTIKKKGWGEKLLVFGKTTLIRTEGLYIVSFINSTTITCTINKGQVLS